MPQPTLILGAAFGYPSSTLLRFLKSLERVSFKGRVVLLVNQQYRDLEEFDSCFALELVLLSSVPYHVQCFRYRVYEEFLRSDVGEGNMVFLSDISDVYLQWNPFEDLSWSSSLNFFAEPKKIGECPYNTGWLSFAYGKKVAAQLAPFSILCSGTTIGRREAVIAYLTAMREAIETHLNRHVQLPIGFDQGVHNALVRSRAFDGLSPRILTNEEAIVGTLGYAEKMIDGRGLFVNKSGAPFGVVHQWNRANCALLQLISERTEVDFTDHLSERPKANSESRVSLSIVFSGQNVRVFDGLYRDLTAEIKDTFRRFFAEAHLGDRWRESREVTDLPEVDSTGHAGERSLATESEQVFTLLTRSGLPYLARSRGGEHIPLHRGRVEYELHFMK